MGVVYHKKKDGENAHDDRTINWYDYYRDKVLNRPRTEVETHIDLPKGKQIIINEELPRSSEATD